MELREYIQILRRRHTLVVVPLLLIVLASLALSVLGPRAYKSSTTLFFSQDSSAAASTQDDQRLASYVSLVQSPRVAAAVVDRLQLDQSLDDVRDSLSAATKPGTLLVEVTATASSPRLARRVATVATNELVKLSGDLEPNPGGTNTTGLRLAEQATPAVAQSVLVRNLALGIALGLFVGVLLAFVREGMDDRITSEDQLLGDYGLRTLAHLPVAQDHEDATQLLAGKRRPLDPAYRRLRLALQLASPARPRTLIVVACSADAGATTASAGLGMTLANAGLRVIVVCADPARTAAIGAPLPGLTEVLSGEASLDQTLRASSHQTLWRLLPGRDADFLDELLSSDAMSQLVKRLHDLVDVVLIEAPPLPESSAAPLLSESTGAGVVVVVRYGETRRDELGRAVELVRLGGAPLLGAIVTRTPADQGRRRVASLGAWAGSKARRPSGLDATSVDAPVASQSLRNR